MSFYSRNVLSIGIKSSVCATFNINEINVSMSKHKSKKSLNFIKCIVYDANIWHLEKALHLISNTYIPTMDNTSMDYLEHLNDLTLYNVNDEMKNIFKSKLIYELAGLTVNYTAEQKIKLFEEIYRQLKEERIGTERGKENII